MLSWNHKQLKRNIILRFPQYSRLKEAVNNFLYEEIRGSQPLGAQRSKCGSVRRGEVEESYQFNSPSHSGSNEQQLEPQHAVLLGVTHLLVFSISICKPKVIFFQQVQMFTYFVKQHLASGAFLWRTKHKEKSTHSTKFSQLP